VLPDWDSDEGWIDVLSAAPTDAQVVAVAVPAGSTTDTDDWIISQEPSIAIATCGLLNIALEYSIDGGALNTGEAFHGSVDGSRDRHCLEISVYHQLAACKSQFCSSSRSFNNEVDFVLAHDHALILPILLCFSSHVFFSCPSRHVELANSEVLI
jgi:hypothetical protein